MTAVEFLWNRLEEIRIDLITKSISNDEASNQRTQAFKQAKEMFEQQIIDAYRRSTYQFEVDAKINCRTAEQYYNEQFKNK